VHKSWCSKHSHKNRKVTLYSPTYWWESRRCRRVSNRHPTMSHTLAEIMWTTKQPTTEPSERFA